MFKNHNLQATRKLYILWRILYVYASNVCDVSGHINVCSATLRMIYDIRISSCNQDIHIYNNSAHFPDIEVQIVKRLRLITRCCRVSLFFGTFVAAITQCPFAFDVHVDSWKLMDSFARTARAYNSSQNNGQPRFIETLLPIVRSVSLDLIWALFAFTFRQSIPVNL